MVSVRKGGPGPDSGWVAHGYGIKLPSWRAQFSWGDTTKRINAMYMLMIPYDVQRDRIDLFPCDVSCDADPYLTDFTINDKRYSIAIGNNNHLRFTIDQREINIQLPAPPVS